MIEAEDVLVIVMFIKVRDLKRSLSEDDKRRLDKKEKRKREEKARAAHAAGVGAHCWHHAEVENTVLKQTYCSETNIHLVQESLGAAGYWE